MGYTCSTPFNELSWWEGVKQGLDPSCITEYFNPASAWRGYMAPEPLPITTAPPVQIAPSTSLTAPYQPSDADTLESLRESWDIRKEQLLKDLNKPNPPKPTSNLNWVLIASGVGLAALVFGGRRH